MSNPEHLQILRELVALDFAGKGEAFVEQKFLTPLLKCLGYDAHKDYEVRRHGDDGTAFKLRYPPVEKGATRIKHYSPDYVPTIRKKMFWIIEAKSPKDIPDPFEARYVVQGLQYCIHPEIQAKYLLLTNGADSAIYDAHSSVFFGKDIYEPILRFKSSELSKRWDEIFTLLSVETLRTRIEADLKTMYDKLCLSSLDSAYPDRLLRQIGASAGENAQQIRKHVIKLYVEDLDRDTAASLKEMEQLSATQVFELMELPLPPGKMQAHIFVDKCFADGVPAAQILTQLTHDFERQSIFRKEQSFVAACALYHRTDDALVKESCRAFFDHYKDADLPLLNQVECALLRIFRKATVVYAYPELKKQIEKVLQTAPELIRFVRPPTVLDRTYDVEILVHDQMFERIKPLLDDQLTQLLSDLLKTEAAIENAFKVARSKLSDSERQMSGFENYCVGGKHYAFKNILAHFGIEPKEDI